MKRYLFIMIAIAAVLASCNDYETYGEKKDKERNAISEYISKNNITVISEDQFKQQGEMTNVEKNEFVRFDKNGVYMQIVRPGVGSILQDKGKATIVCRFSNSTFWLIASRGPTIYRDMPRTPISCTSPVPAVFTQLHS